ncbi:MAG: substrate-binding domain-containing protein, partial [Synergistaceae bacterium]|nr:substrate-binding domain-containing protein [Synergistaceae bacterium]
MKRKWKYMFVVILVISLIGVLTASAAESDQNDFAELYGEVSKLSGEEAYEFFSGLKDKGLSDDQILQFFIGLPLSDANKSISKVYNDDGLATYATTYPSGEGIDGYVWRPGSGTQITGPFTKQDLKLPFTDYIPVPAGTIGDPNKEYIIGALAGGSTSPWSGNLVDSMIWQGNQFSNVDVVFQEHLGDDSKFTSIMDTFIARRVDAIVLHPRSEAVSMPAVRRAMTAGIPVVTVDMLSGYPDVVAQIAGNFSANGTQNAMALVEKLHDEGSYDAKMVMIR